MLLKRIRRLRISLAAKCQILFGAAMALIIGAALFVPWQRMDQLTRQLDQSAASALADGLLRQHVWEQRTGTAAPARPDTPVTEPPTNTEVDADADADDGPGDAPGDDAIADANVDAVADTAESDQSTERQSTDDSANDTEEADAKVAGEAPGGATTIPQDPPVSRLIAVDTPWEGPRLASFDRRAFRHFEREPDARWYERYYKRPDGSQGYRYAQPLFLTRDCAACHEMTDEGNLVSWTDVAAMGFAAEEIADDDDESPSPTATGTQPAEAQPTGTQPTGEPPPLIGIATVEIPSRIDANQLLLNRVFILAAGLLAGTIAIIALYFITTRLILQPVRVLQETAEKVSQGDLNIRSDISTGDEFQQLSETFNAMLTNLKQSADQLRALNKSLDLKLGELAESNLALFESNRLKSEFLANVSHELRTPLNSILGFADLLRDALTSAAAATGAGAGGNGKPAILGPDGRPHAPKADASTVTTPATPPPPSADPKTARYVNNILQSGRHLLDLINDLLDLAKIEAGRMEIRSEPLSLNDLFEGLTNILKPLAENRGLTIVPAVARDVPIIHTDPARLQQVLYNFLSNAIKFSPPGGRIDLHASRDDADHVRISVTDRGPGIDPEKHQVIFEKFRQVDSGPTRTHGGTGLGLAIARELTQLLGGSIGVWSAKGQGATFWVVLPLRIQPGAMDLRGRMVLT